MNRRVFNAVALAVAGVAIAVLLYVRYRVAPDIAFSNLRLQTIDGRPASMNDYRGKAVFLNFWATWCPDCRREMPSIVRAQQQLKDENIVFLLVSDEPQEKLQQFVASHDHPFVWLQSGQKLKELGIHAIPCTYLIDSKGEITRSHVGTEAWDDPVRLDELRALCH